MELSLYIKDKLVSGKRIAIPIMTHPGIELLGKQVSDAVTNGEIHYHAIRALNECFPAVGGLYHYYGSYRGSRSFWSST